MSSTNLNFHKTFKPERQYISGLLVDLQNCDGLSVDDISNQTGIPTGKSSGKVEPTISYMGYMGLINSEKKQRSYHLRYTSIGNIVKDEDGGLLEKITLLLLHCMISRRYTGAELWAYVIHNVFPKYRNSLTEKQFEKEIELQFGDGVKLGPYKGSYQGLFGPLNLIDIAKDSVVLHSSKIDNDYVYLYGLILYLYWDEWYKNETDDVILLASRSEITADHLARIGFRYPFGWSVETEYQVLELLDKKKIVALNRQMVPYTIRRIEDIDTLVNRLYSELC